MGWQKVTDKERKAYNKVVHHPLQSYEWGEFREKTGVKVIREALTNKDQLTAAFTMTIHPIPHTPWNIGYLPKGDFPDPDLIRVLKQIGKEQRCLFIQLEPNVYKNQRSNIQSQLSKLGLRPAAHPLFTRFTFVLDLSKSEDELLKNFHPKTRYNIKVAKKHNVTIAEKDTDDAFQNYLRISDETTKRQKFFAHSHTYHKLQWETLPHTAKPPYNELSSHLFTANYNLKTLAAWILFVFHDTLYYPYGSSTSEHRETMASNLLMWEAIRFGKKLGLKKFDMWGALGPEPDTNDSWYGFHHFKQGYRPEHVEFAGSFDLVLNPVLYATYTVADKLRWLMLKIK